MFQATILIVNLLVTATVFLIGFLLTALAFRDRVLDFSLEDKLVLFVFAFIFPLLAFAYPLYEYLSGN